VIGDAETHAPGHGATIGSSERPIVVRSGHGVLLLR
jgi:hypothetical protein